MPTRKPNDGDDGVPANLDAEKFVLGSLLLDGSKFTATNTLVLADFALEKHQRIFRRMLHLNARGDEINRVTVVEELKRNGELESVGGFGYVNSLDDGMPLLGSIASYIGVLKEKAAERKIQLICQDLTTRVGHGETASQLVVAAQELLGGVAIHSNGITAPMVLSVTDLYDQEYPVAEMLIDRLVPMLGASLIVGSAKSGKTIFATQMAIAVAQGTAVLDYYKVFKQGPAMIIEQDDPSGAGSIKTILQRAGVARGVPVYVVPRVPFAFGPELIAWLEEQIRALDLRLIILDSYTALRGSRSKGIDIVKAEQEELRMLDDVAKRTGCSIQLIHHGSKGSAALDWSDNAAGSFAMSAATESQIHVSRFKEFDGTAPERLIRARGRHSGDIEMVLRFREPTLDFEHVLEGGAAPFYPFLQQIKLEFGNESFSPKELTHATGLPISTANRHISRLYRAGALQKRGYGEYSLAGLGL